MVKHTQTIRWQTSTNCLGVFDHLVGLGIVDILCQQPRGEGVCGKSDKSWHKNQDGGGQVIKLRQHVSEFHF